MKEKFINLFIALILIPSTSSSSCGHDKFQALMPKNFHSEEIVIQSRHLQSSQRENIRILAYYDLKDAPEADQKEIKEQLFPAVIGYYQAALKVNRFDTLKVSTSDLVACKVTVQPPELIEGVNADFIIFAKTMKDEETDFLAVAGACLFHPNNRPKLGVVTLNLKYGWSGKDERGYERMLYTIIHEFGHALGFSGSLFNKYINPTTGQTLTDSTAKKTVNGQTITILQTEPLVSKVRKHFGCNSLEGAYIEQEGGDGSAGSHFERRVFFNDVITASLMTDGRVSELFLAALEGSGWYFPNYDMAEPFLWGQGKGCDFLEKTCLDGGENSRFPDYFCSGGDVTGKTSSCLFGGKGQGVCLNNDKFADGCPYYVQYSGRDCQNPNSSPLFSGETFGNQSFCFEGTFNKNNNFFCLKQTCQRIGSQYQITVDVGTEQVVCKSTGSITVPNYSGTIDCPDPNTFCSTIGVSYCARGCMGRGVCKDNGICECYPGYYGQGCSYRTGEYPPEGDIRFFLGISEDNNSFHFISIAIGVGIIACVVIIGVIVNKVRFLKNRRANQRSAETANVNADASSIINLNASKPSIQTTVYRANIYQSVSGENMAPANPDHIQFGVINENQIQYQPSQGETLRQEALRSNFEQNSAKGGPDPLAVLRGARG